MLPERPGVLRRERFTAAYLSNCKETRYFEVSDVLLAESFGNVGQDVEHQSVVSGVFPKDLDEHGPKELPVKVLIGLL